MTVKVRMKTHRIDLITGDMLNLRILIQGDANDVASVCADLEGMCWIDSLALDWAGDWQFTPAGSETAVGAAVTGEIKAVELVKEFLADFTEETT